MSDSPDEDMPEHVSHDSKKRFMWPQSMHEDFFNTLLFIGMDGISENDLVEMSEHDAQSKMYLDHFMKQLRSYRSSTGRKRKKPCHDASTSSTKPDASAASLQHAILKQLHTTISLFNDTLRPTTPDTSHSPRAPMAIMSEMQTLFNGHRVLLNKRNDQFQQHNIALEPPADFAISEMEVPYNNWEVESERDLFDFLINDEEV